MRAYFLILFAYFISNTAKAQKPAEHDSLFIKNKSEKIFTCVAVHTGIFYDKKRIAKHTRTIDHELTVCPTLGYSWIWKLVWLNDCEYLQILEKNLSKSSNRYSIGDTIRVKILQVSSDKYDWECWYKNIHLTGFNYRTN